MKKLFGISMICVFTVLLFVTFAYAAWPPEANVVGGYAKITDSSSYKFGSDGDGYYTDVHLKPAGEYGEKIELAFDKTSNAFIGFLAYLGKPDSKSYPNASPLDPDPNNQRPYWSSRQSNFLFDLKDGVTTFQYKSYKAAFDILVWKDAAKKIRRGNQVGKKYYLNDESVRLGIRKWHDVSGSNVHDMVFTVEPSDTPYSGCGTGAVTETAINNFYGNDTNYNYEDYVGIGTSVCDLVVYNISFDNDFNVVQSGASKWTISGGGRATLRVVTVISENPHVVSWIPLATYTDLPFQIQLSTTPNFSAAPPKSDKSTTLWGEIKSR